MDLGPVASLRAWGDGSAGFRRASYLAARDGGIGMLFMTLSTRRGTAWQPGGRAVCFLSPDLALTATQLSMGHVRVLYFYVFQLAAREATLASATLASRTGGSRASCLHDKAGNRPLHALTLKNVKNRHTCNPHPSFIYFFAMAILLAST